MNETVAVVGGGWYGCHIALTFAKAGFKVTLYEKNNTIFGGISGMFGVRAHAGPHYPRSEITRKGCRDGLVKFTQTYPELLNQHEYSVYGLGKLDSDNKPPKVSLEEFKMVCEETGSARTININEQGSEYQNLFYAADVNEPSIPVGKRLATTFQDYLRKAGVTVSYSVEIEGAEKRAGKIVVKLKNGSPVVFDHFINTTGFQSLRPDENLPLQMKIFYQPCLALVYEDMESGLKPFSFIVMDGWFPCIMPYDNRPNGEGPPSSKYIVTHGKWTIMGSHKNPHDAYEQLAAINNDFIEKKVRPRCEEQMIRFWPGFKGRFEYRYWVGSVLPKVQTEREFRSAITFQDKDDIIHVFPGKVTNIFSAADESLSLVRKQAVIADGTFRYVKNGALHEAEIEIIESLSGVRNTCNLQTRDELHFSLPSLNFKRHIHIPRNSPLGRIFFMLGTILLISIKLLYKTASYTPILSSLLGLAGCIFAVIISFLSAFKLLKVAFNHFANGQIPSIFFNNADPTLSSLELGSSDARNSTINSTSNLLCKNVN